MVGTAWNSRSDQKNSRTISEAYLLKPSGGTAWRLAAGLRSGSRSAALSLPGIVADFAGLLALARRRRQRTAKTAYSRVRNVPAPASTSLSLTVYEWELERAGERPRRVNAKDQGEFWGRPVTFDGAVSSPGGGGVQKIVLDEFYGGPCVRPRSCHTLPFGAAPAA